MRRRLHPAVIVTVALAAAAALFSWRLVAEGRGRSVEAGFWFEDVAFRSPRLGGSLTAEDMALVERTARAEIDRAFAGLRIRVGDNRRARYHVRVVQAVLDARMRWPVNVAGQSRGMSGFGGSGLVNFDVLAGGAIVYAPDSFDRVALVEAIGRGVGRAAVHELTHLLLPRAPIHRSRDKASYEYYAAGRAEQYLGDARWDLAGPLLRQRLGPT